jgi:hypothetical protein
MMNVARMRRGWRVRLTDNEMEVLREAVKRGLPAIDKTTMPYKLRKVLGSRRWRLPHGPLWPDDDRRPA